MSEDKSSEDRFNRNLLLSMVVTSALLLLLPMFFVIGKDTAYSAYEVEELYQELSMQARAG